MLANSSSRGPKGAAAGAKTAVKDTLPAERVLWRLMHNMTLIRRFEEKIVEVYPAQDMKTPVHLCLGQEAIAAGVCDVLRREDYLFTTHRSHGHCLAKGMDLRSLAAELYGRVDGCCRGKGGSMHPVAPEVGILGTTAIVGGGIPIAAGTAMKSKLTGDGRVSVVFFGDGATEEGSFHESLNFAALKKLPVVFVCENNSYATSSHLSARQPHSRIEEKAASYGMPGCAADGNDAVAVRALAAAAVRRARAGRGPSLLVLPTYRWTGHVGPECDWVKGCRPKEELDRWIRRCPLKRLAKKMREAGLFDRSRHAAMLRRLDALIEDAFAFGKASAYPGLDELARHVYIEKA